MNYQQTIDYLYNTLPMFSRMGSAAYKKDLTNIRILCERLGNPQEKFKSIHVGGTNGKGSVSHMLSAILQTGGYKTGLYTSPHLYDFRERIKINGDLADPNFVVAFVEKVKPWIEEIQPSFFEITVAMAFEYFVAQMVDVAVIEVGLGGRLDSTNIIRPELSIITNIGWDHMNILGNSLQKIAGEKAGIIKENVPVVIGEMIPETKPVFQKTAQVHHSLLLDAASLLQPVCTRFTDETLAVEYEGSNGIRYQITTDLPGIYQVKNIATVLVAAEQLQKQGWKIYSETITAALPAVKGLTGLHGRWELIHKEPRVVLDVAHNKDGIQQLLLHLQQLSFKKLHLVLGMVKDKEAEGVLALLPKEACYYFTQANIPRALDARELRAKAESFHLQGRVYQNVNVALREALHTADREDLIIVCGSIFLVAEVDR